MAQQVELTIAPRDVMGKASKRLRKAGLIPGNIYGHKEPSRAVQLDGMAFERLRREHGTRNIIRLRLPNGTETVLIRHVQRDAKTDHILHIDFARVSLRERVNVKVPLHFVGEAPGVKNYKGILLHLLEALEVECQASDIVEAIEVDVSSLAEINDTLYARDVKLPSNYKLLVDPEEPIAKVAAPKVEVEEVAAEAEAVEAPAEGEAPAKEPEEGAE
jgi:large subunit ribosomal protein L25